MRFYNRQHTYYCGIDLHVKTMYVCILDGTGQVLVHRNVPSTLVATTEIVFGTDFPAGGTSAAVAKTLVEIGMFGGERPSGDRSRECGDSCHASPCTRAGTRRHRSSPTP